MSTDLTNLFDTVEDFPRNLAERGVPPNCLLNYVSHYFLQGYINLLKINKVVMVRRYSEWHGDSESNEFLITTGDNRVVNSKLYNDSFKETSNTNFADAPDDLLILAESENDNWFLWIDKDSSDCSIGRVDKTERGFVRMYTVLMAHDEARQKISYKDGKHCWTELPKPKGWILL